MSIKVRDLDNGFKVAFGQHASVAADDTVVTGLREITMVVASLDDAPVAGCQVATAVKPASGGSISVKTWKATDTADTAVVAATTFGKKVNWIAFGY